MDSALLFFGLVATLFTIRTGKLSANPDNLRRYMTKRKPRHTAHVVHSQDSKSGGWMILRDDQGFKFFAHRKSLLDPTAQPALGWNVSFTVLPPLPGQPLHRATEVEIMKSTRGGQIEIEHSAGVTRLILRSTGRERVIGELQL
jgi:hypothetical protein